MLSDSYEKHFVHSASHRVRFFYMTVLKLPPFLQICLVIKCQSREVEKGQAFPTMSHYFLRRLLLKFHYEVKDPLTRNETRSNKEKQHRMHFLNKTNNNNNIKSTSDALPHTKISQCDGLEKVFLPQILQGASRL